MNKAEIVELDNELDRATRALIFMPLEQRLVIASDPTLRDTIREVENRVYAVRGRLENERQRLAV